MNEMPLSTEPAFKTAIARIYRGNMVIGAGFIVEGGYLLTCAHVVRDAIALKADDSAIGQILKVNFPYISLRQKLTAEVLLYRYNKDENSLDEDVAGLHIIDDLPSGVSPIRLVATYPPRSRYSVVGFPKGHTKGIASYGQLLEDLPNGLVQLEDTKEQGVAILPGFSGSPVWDETTNAAVGMVVAREKEQPEAKIGFMVPARHLIAARRELVGHSLLRLLQDASEASGRASELLDNAFKKAYQLCAPAGWATPESLAKKLASLQDAKRGESQFEAIDRFVALLSLPELNSEEALRGRLYAWLKHRVDNLHGLLNNAQDMLMQHEAAQAAGGGSHLLIYVKEESGDARSVAALFLRYENEYDAQRGRGAEPVQAPGEEPFNEKVTQEKLPDLVRACVQEVLNESPADLTLHLILPLAWLNQACDRWSFIEEEFSFLPSMGDRVGVRFHCLVRIAERLNPKIWNMFREPWQKKWQKLLSLAGHNVCPAFILGDDLSLETELLERLNRPESVGLRVSKVYTEKQYEKLFGVLIYTGIPAALWLRHDQFAEAVCSATALEQLLGCRIATLPETVKQCRSEAMGSDENAHIGHHLSFLWDNPALIPPSTQMSLGMPQS